MNLNEKLRNVENCLFEGKKELKASGAEEYALDCELFMMKSTGLSKIQLFTRNDYILSDEEYNTFVSMVERRQKGEPCQYITGTAYFFDHEFEVNSNVLIPRNDTEILVETVIEYGKKHGFKTMLDIGTGSGCIAISLALEGFEMTAVDISKGALETAKKNADKNGAKVEFINSDVFSSVSGRKFDAIVSNPPYIEKDVIPTLMKDVKDFEPMSALDGGEDGLDFYRQIIREGKEHLNENGFIFFEIGYNQGEAVKNLFEESRYSEVRVIQDLAGLDRVVLGKI